jgi:hypothetical protein
MNVFIMSFCYALKWQKQVFSSGSDVHAKFCENHTASLKYELCRHIDIMVIPQVLHFSLRKESRLKLHSQLI